MDTVKAKIAGQDVELVVEERVYPDRTCGQYDSGWWTFDPNSNLDNPTEFFVSDDGSVYNVPENDCVGIAPEVKAQSDRFEAMMEEASSHAG